MPEPTVIETLPEEIRSTLAPELIADPEITKYKNLGEVFNAAKQAGKPWYDSLAPELKADPNIAKYKTPDDLVKGHLEAVKLIGSKGVIIPGKDAKPEDVDKFYNTLGRPEKAEGYKFTPIEGIPDALKPVPEVEAAVKGLFHKAGITQAQADLIQSEYTKMQMQSIAKQQESFTAQRQAAETALRNEWAQDYDKNIALARRVVEVVGGKGAADAFGDIGNNPTVLKFLAKVGKSMSEDSIDRLGISPLQTNAAEAKRQIDSILNMSAEARKEHPYWNENHRDHQKAIKELQELYKIAYPAGGQ